MDAAKDREDLINDFAWYETAELHVNKLEESHGKERDPCLYDSEDVTMPAQLVAPSWLRRAMQV